MSDSDLLRTEHPDGCRTANEEIGVSVLLAREEMLTFRTPVSTYLGQDIPILGEQERDAIAEEFAGHLEQRMMPQDPYEDSKLCRRAYVLSSGDNPDMGAG